MFNDKNGPIEHFSWGKFIINGEEHSKNYSKIGVGKDIRLVNNKVTKWKERKGHELTKSMITGIFNKNVDILIIGIGVNGAIECSEKVIQFIQKNGIKKVKLLKTPKACNEYNNLFHQGKKVALLAHGTC
jgi:hypothetical protein